MTSAWLKSGGKPSPTVLPCHAAEGTWPDHSGLRARRRASRPSPGRPKPRGPKHLSRSSGGMPRCSLPLRICIRGSALQCSTWRASLRLRRPLLRRPMFVPSSARSHHVCAASGTPRNQAALARASTSDHRCCYRSLERSPLLNQALYASGELREHLCRRQTGAPRQLSRVAVAGKRKTWIDEQKQGRPVRRLVRYPKPQQSALLFPIVLRQLSTGMGRPHHPPLRFVRNERRDGARNHVPGGEDQPFCHAGQFRRGKRPLRSVVAKRGGIQSSRHIPRSTVSESSSRRRGFAGSTG